MSVYQIRKAKVIIRTYANGQLVKVKVCPNRRVYQNDNGTWRMFDENGRKRVPITQTGRGIFEYNRYLIEEKCPGPMEQLIMELREGRK